MDNVLYQSAYDELAENVDKTLRFIKQIRENLAKDSSKEQLDMHLPEQMICLLCNVPLVRLQSNIAERIRLNISWYDVAQDATHNI